VQDKFRVLALTFTNKAADEMRNRVESFVPGQLHRLFLGTFHSFCADVLRQHGVHLGINPKFEIYSNDADLQQILNDAVKDAVAQGVAVSELDKKTLPIIKRLKSNLVTPENCKGAFRDQELAERIAAIYPAYEAQLRAKNALDFESLIYETFRLFNQFPAFAKRYRTVYPYICVDEFQDTNPAQYSLLRALAGDQHRNFFVVADDDQIIYQWNGASHKRIEQFVQDFRPKVVQLPMNYRCPPEVVTLANNLISHNFLRTQSKQPLQAIARPSHESDVRLLPCFRDFDNEASGVAKDIKTAHRAGSVAVLARTRKLLEGVEQALMRERVPACIMQRKNDFESIPFSWLHAMLRLANDRQSYHCLEIVCGTFQQLTGVETDPDEIIAQAKAGNGDYLQHFLKSVLRSQLPEAALAVVRQISHDLGEGRDFRQFTRVALEWFSFIAENTSAPHGNEVQSEKFARYDEEKTVWNELWREIGNSLGSQPSLEAFLQELQMHSKETPPEPGAVVLMTIHSAKGKEFDHVYIVGLVEDELPSFQSKQKGDQSPEMEEERRNCFVAITRTIKTLTLSYAARYRSWPKEPSRFISEMGLIE
jgi:DNA helicase-2/ATP-dependent DNA helicase PcrA